MQKPLIPARVFALRAWTIKVDDKGQYFISPTACFEERSRWSGPYRSLQHATHAIAGKLRQEVLDREKRRLQGEKRLAAAR
jgi:hypothetical protein